MKKELICADCDKENCNKPSGWHISYWLKYRTAEGLLKTINDEPSIFDAAVKDPEMLQALCKELGWNGGTMHQVVDEIIKQSHLK